MSDEKTQNMAKKHISSEIRCLVEYPSNDDLTALSNVINTTYSIAESGMWPPEHNRISSAALSSLITSGEIFAAYSGSQIIGIVRLYIVNDDTAGFGLLAVDPSAHGTGVGRALVKFVEEKARAEGCKAMRLELLYPRDWLHPGREFLKHWYERMGYQKYRIGTLAEYSEEFAKVLITPCNFVFYEKSLI